MGVAKNPSELRTKIVRGVVVRDASLWGGGGMSGTDLGRTDFSRMFVFEPPDFVAGGVWVGVG